MKTIFAVCSAAILVLTANFTARAGIIAGPITNPANGHDYYLLTPNTWTASEVEAEQLGGTLVVINNAAEEKWVFSKFGSYGGTSRNLWIGLRRQGQGGPFAWVTDEKPGYFKWHPGQPDNGGGVENCVHIWTRNSDYPNSWNDAPDNWSAGDDTPCGVVEVPGKSNEKSLTAQEKSLIGTWYCNGDPDQPCWIAGTDNLLFAVDQNKDASRAVYTSEGLLFSPKWKQHAEIVQDKILWSKGNWWSRKPVEYKTRDISLDKTAAQPPSGGTTDETVK
jgi:hypothetical protein